MTLRPRFSVRTLAIFVTLVCAYFGAWDITERYGVTEASIAEQSFIDDTGQSIFRDSPCPFVIREYVFGYAIDPRNAPKAWERKTYRLWLFGKRYKLPIESEFDHWKDWDAVK